MDNFTIRMVDNSGLLDKSAVEERMLRCEGILQTVREGEEEYRDSLGWLSVSKWAGEEWLQRYETLAERVRKNADVLVVIGIGGSNQAARAVIDAIGEKGSVKIVWAGNSISAHSVHEYLKELTGKRVYIDVIAKNFETLEPGIGFRVMRDWLKKEYGEAYSSHVICTGTSGSHLEELCTEHGYEFLPFPDDIGGRYTALSPIGLFPVCAAGLNIRRMAEGAEAMEVFLKTCDLPENDALRLAVMRNMLLEKGFHMEMLSFFEPRFFRFAKWWMQLFGESEGKELKGLYPVYACFSEDLHSIGQFLQDGSRDIYEIFLNVKDSGFSYVLHDDEVDDHFHYLDGMDFDAINRAACEATIEAHSRKYPCICMEVPAIDEYSFGMLFYFFAFTCYLSAKILGVNPFDQPGVEAYKINMFEKLGK